MQALPAAGAVEFLLMFLFAGGGLPLGVPPQAEDPLLGRIAPEECLVYTMSAGTRAADGDSTNGTERLLAEPEVRQFTAEIERRLTTMIRASLAPRGDDTDLAAVNFAVAAGKRLLTHPVAAYIERAEKKDEELDVEAGLLVKTGEETEEIAKQLKELLALLLGDKTEEVTIKGMTFQRFHVSPDDPPVTWGVRGHYLIFGVGEGSVEKMLTRADTPAPKWLAEAAAKLAIEQRSTLSVVNVRKVIQAVTPLAGEQAALIAKASGLDQVVSLVATTGLDDVGFVSKSFVEIEGEPRGLLALIDAKPLTEADLQPIPQDAVAAAAVRLSGEKLLAEFFNLISAADEREGARVQRSWGEVEERLGIDVRRDVLAAIGDAWCLFANPSEGGVLTGWTATVAVRDHESLARAHARFREIIREGDPRDSALKEMPFQGETIYYMNYGNGGPPIAPAWCVTKDRMIVGLFPQAVKGFLSHGAKEESLATIDGVKQQLGEQQGTLGLFYADEKKLFPLIYSGVQIVSQLAASQGLRSGFDFDTAILPSGTSIERHLGAAVTVVRRVDGGVEFSSRQTVPAGNIGTTAPLAAALLIPAVGSARGAAQRTSSMNNLKQLAIGVHNYADVYAKLPAAYGIDKEGKPLLSWRVYLLPYMEGETLFRKFRLDEPWDSDHNKALISEMPQVYRAPGSAAGEGKTNYLAVRGKGAVIDIPPDGEKGSTSPTARRFGDILDGTSNTAMIVEADDKHAVTWTKPDDFAWDKMAPARGLIGLRQGGFLVAMTDGSVRLIAETIDAETLRRLFTRDDGQPIELDR